ncbi:TetR family transcriptional regulator [Neorhizobium sp. JUb45]|nr:TetR family transcriptional regulator [Neorhizobium sp. JUb45]
MRIQTVVHGAVQELLTAMDRAEVTVPMIAEKAGVTPSTIHRRWGDLADLLADVAVARMRSQPVRGPPAQLVPIGYSPWRLWRSFRSRNLCLKDRADGSILFKSG